MDDLSDDEVLDTQPYKDSFEISKEKADMLYEKAGELVAEDADQLTIEKYEHLLSDKVHGIIQEVLQKNNVGYELQDFQFKIGLGRMESTKQAKPSPNSAVTFQSFN